MANKTTVFCQFNENNAFHNCKKDNYYNIFLKFRKTTIRRLKETAVYLPSFNANAVPCDNKKVQKSLSARNTNIDSGLFKRFSTRLDSFSKLK